MGSPGGGFPRQAASSFGSLATLQATIVSVKWARTRAMRGRPVGHVTWAVKRARTRAMPRYRVCVTPPTVLAQPKGLFDLLPAPLGFCVAGVPDGFPSMAKCRDFSNMRRDDHLARFGDEAGPVVAAIRCQGQAPGQSGRMAVEQVDGRTAGSLKEQPPAHHPLRQNQKAVSSPSSIQSVSGYGFPPVKIS